MNTGALEAARRWREQKHDYHCRALSLWEGVWPLLDRSNICKALLDNGFRNKKGETQPVCRQVHMIIWGTCMASSV